MVMFKDICVHYMQNVPDAKKNEIRTKLKENIS
jgi:hypothetical protein